jgi:hypothetical protein
MYVCLFVEFIIDGLALLISSLSLMACRDRNAAPHNIAVVLEIRHISVYL